MLIAVRDCYKISGLLMNPDGAAVCSRRYTPVNQGASRHSGRILRVSTDAVRAPLSRARTVSSGQPQRPARFFVSNLY